jgi:hypothetical protein
MIQFVSGSDSSELPGIPDADTSQSASTAIALAENLPERNL